LFSVLHLLWIWGFYPRVKPNRLKYVKKQFLLGAVAKSEEPGLTDKLRDKILH
jgi:hypothetical protein